MRKTSSLQWIEAREARNVLAAAEFAKGPLEGASSRMLSRGAALRKAASAWLARAAALLATAGPARWPVLQAQPVLVRRPIDVRLRDRGDGYYR